MKSLRSVYFGLGLIPFSVLAATNDSSDVSLESYLKEDHPEIYQSLIDQKIDIKALEAKGQDAPDNTKALLISNISEKRHPREICQSKEIGGVFLENNYVAACVNKCGTFGYNFGSRTLGMTFNSHGSGTVIEPDFLKPGTPHEYFSVSIGSSVYTNNTTQYTNVLPKCNIPTTVIPLNQDVSPNKLGGALVTSAIGGLTVKQKYSLDPDAREIIMRTEIINTGSAPIGGIKFARGIDPDQDMPNTFKTWNKKGFVFTPNPYPSLGGLPPSTVSFPDFTLLPVTYSVAPENIVWAVGEKSRLFIALYSIDPVTHNTCVSPIWTTNPSDIISGSPSSCVAPSFNDSTINMGFDVGTLGVGETKVFSYRYMFKDTRKRLPYMPYLNSDFKLVLPFVEYKPAELASPMYLSAEMSPAFNGSKMMFNVDRYTVQENSVKDVETTSVK